MCMRNTFWASLSVATLALTLPSAEAETAAGVAARMQADIDRGEMPAWWTPELPDAIQRDVDSKGKRLAGQLTLGDEAKTQAVAALITEHFGRLWAWDQQVREKLDAAWAAWDAARDNSNGKEKDELKALAVMTEQIDPIYAQFTPQIQGLLRALHHEIGEEKTTELLDLITRSPGAKRTFDAYVAMVPEMTDDEKAILWDRMAGARMHSRVVFGPAVIGGIAWRRHERMHWQPGATGRSQKSSRSTRSATSSRSTISGTAIENGTRPGPKAGAELTPPGRHGRWPDADVVLAISRLFRSQSI